MKILVNEARFAVCRLAPSDEVPVWASSATFFAISRTPTELSIVCEESRIPSGIEVERNWRLLGIQGPLDFAMTGVLASIAKPLAEARISIFAVSTFDTDYILVKDSKLRDAIECLSANGFEIIENGSIGPKGVNPVEAFQLVCPEPDAQKYKSSTTRWAQGDFAVETDPGLLDLSRIHAFLTKSYWSPGIPKELVKKAISNSLCFGLYRETAHENEQIGFARVVSDKSTFAYLCDLYVEEEWRNKGLAKWLMECVVSHPELKGLRRFSLATRDAHGLYQKFGFETPKKPQSLMEINIPNIYQQSSQNP